MEQTESKIDRQTYRKTDRQMERQTDRETETYTCEKRIGHRPVGGWWRFQVNGFQV